ncbi:MAG TPA: DUF1801 domain-containing protein [Polyangiaceae bacterium]|nr:DUF1801 domain-containing protein [Polyangiaceae bacterium]
MAKTDYQSVDEYIAAQPEGTRAALERVRAAIRRALPKAEERISYQIAGYRTDAGTVIYFAGWKQHYSVYPVGPALAASFEGALDRYLAQKDTLRFPLTEPVPAKLIERVARARAREAAEFVAARRAGKKKGPARAAKQQAKAPKSPAKKAAAAVRRKPARRKKAAAR